ncbi:hypothetical protein Tco_0451823 [Tanacetum coccineum]
MTHLSQEDKKTAQAKEIASLKNRVKKLERKRKSKTLGMKRLFKIGRSAQVVSFEDEEVTLVDETKGRYNDAQIFDTNVFNGEEVFVVEQSEKVVKEVVSTAEVSAAVTITTEEITLAQALAELRSAKPKVVVQEPVTTLTPIPSNIKDKGKAKMIKTEKPLKMKEQIRLDEELDFKLQAEEEEQARLAKEKAKKVKEANILWDNVQAMIEADRLLAERLQAREQEELTDEENARLVNMFVDMDTELVKESSKKAEEEMAQESSSKRAGEELEQEIHRKGRNGYYEIMRADGSTKTYLLFSQLLKEFDIEDLENLWKLVKAKHGNTRPKEGYERVL